MAKRFVKYAKLHTGVFVQGIGDFGVTLPPNKTLGDLEMSLTAEGLFLDIVSLKGTKEQVIVPYGNIVEMVLKAEDGPTSKATK